MARRGGQLAIILIILASIASAQHRDSDLSKVFEKAVREVPATTVERHLREISKLGNRAPGSSGVRKAQEYVRSLAHRLNFRVSVLEPFNVTYPAGQAELRSGNIRRGLYPVWPNLVATSAGTYRGVLVNGDDPAVRRVQRLDGKIVFLRECSDFRWVEFHQKGAAAIVFNSKPSLLHAESAFLDIPIKIPRFVAPGGVEELEGRTVEIQCKQVWESRPTGNLIISVPGTDPRVQHERILIGAHADEWSVVPDGPPSFSSASSLAGLCSILESIAKSPSRRPIDFVVSDAHTLGLQGEREFVAQRLRSDRRSYWFAATLDLTTLGDRLGAFGAAGMYEYRDERRDIVRRVSTQLRGFADRVAPALNRKSGAEVMLDATNGSENRPWQSLCIRPIAVGAEPMLLAGYPAITFRTIDPQLELTGSMRDEAQYVEFFDVERTLLPQIQAVWALLQVPLHNPAKESFDGVPPFLTELAPPSERSLIGGFSTISGRTVTYDPLKSFLPDVPAADSLVVLKGRQKLLSGVLGDLVTSSKDDGKFSMSGVAPVTAFWYSKREPVTIDAFRIDPETGEAVLSAISGVGASQFSRSFEVNTPEKSMPIVMAPVTSRAVYDLIDPATGERYSQIRLLEKQNDAELREYDVQLSTRPNEPALAWIGWNFTGEIRILIGRGDGEIRALLDVSSNSGNATPAMERAKALVELNSSKLKTLDRYRILHGDVQQVHEESARLIKSAESETDALQANRMALKVYPLAKGAASDVVNGVLFYLFLLIPFSVFMERLLLARRSLATQLAGAVSILIIGFLALRAVHPAFALVNQPLIIFVGFAMASLSLMVTVFILSKFDESMRAETEATSSFRRHGVSGIALGVALGNLRRRPLRTWLTVATLAVMSFSVLSFTSIVPSLQISRQDTGRTTDSPRALIRMPSFEPMNEEFLHQLQTSYPSLRFTGEYWKYPAAENQHGALILNLGNAETPIRSVFGFIELTGSGEFDPGVMSSREPPRSTELQGLQTSSVILTTAPIGLDGEPMLPADFTNASSNTGGLGKALRKFTRFDPNSVALLPGSDVRKLGGTLRAIHVQPAISAKVFKSEIDSLSRFTSVPILSASVPGTGGFKVESLSSEFRPGWSGYGLAAIAVILGSLFVLNTMLAGVYERKPEIAIFSAIGMPPKVIAALFFAEAGVLGVLGTVFGYFIAQSAGKAAIAAGEFGGLTLNFSSSTSVIAALIVLAVCLMSAAYPALMAARMASTGEESDPFAQLPDSNEWTLALPLMVQDRERTALLDHLQSWLLVHRNAAIGDLVAQEVVRDSSEVKSRLFVAPFDLGVVQMATFVIEPSAIPNVYSVHLHTIREQGDAASWVRVNRRLMQLVKKELLEWRTSQAKHPFDSKAS